MQIIKTKEFIEYIGHFDNETLCAKLTILADLYAVEHKVGYAKFKIEDEDKLNLVNNKLDYAGTPAAPINVYIDNELITYFYTKTNYSITSTGIFGGSSGAEVSWTAPHPNFLGLSTSQNATEPDVGYAVGDTLYFPADIFTTTFYFYAIYEQQSQPSNPEQTGRVFIKSNNQLIPVSIMQKIIGGTTTDLTGTSWVFNETINISPLEEDYYRFNINYYLTNDSGVSDIRLDLYSDSDIDYFEMDYPNISSAYNTDFGGWQDDNFKSITITGGIDATNTDLIAWLQQNATLTSGGSSDTLQPVNLFSTIEIQAPSTISFTIARSAYITGTTYQAEPNMTWTEWVNSEYNTDNFMANTHNVFSSNYKFVCLNSTPVSCDDLIIENENYQLQTSGG